MAESLTETARYIWENNRPLAITMLVGAGGLALYAVHRAQGQAGQIVQPPAAPTLDTSGQSKPGQTIIVQPAPVNILPTPGTTPPTMSQPVTTPSGPPVTPPVPTPTPVQPPASSANPLIPYGQWPRGVPWQWGQKVTVNATTYTIGPGSNGIIWGVPNFTGNLSQWNAVPIGPGQKVAVYVNNPAAYH